MASDWTSTSLKPEIADVYEIGAKFDGINSDFNVTLFNVNFKNKLGYDTTIGAWANNGHTVNRGVELSGRYFLDDISEIFEGNSIYGNFTYTDAEYKDEFAGNKVELTSAYTGLIGYEIADDTWSTYIELYGQSEQYADAANTVEENDAGDQGIIGGYGLVNIGYNKNISFNNKKVTFNAGIKNLLDKETFSRSTDTLGNGKYRGEPRSINFSVKVNF